MLAGTVGDTQLKNDDTFEKTDCQVEMAVIGNTCGRFRILVKTDAEISMTEKSYVLLQETSTLKMAGKVFLDSEAAPSEDDELVMEPSDLLKSDEIEAFKNWANDSYRNTNITNWEQAKNLWKDQVEVFHPSGTNEDIYNNSDHFQEMARIGKFGNYIISVFSNDGPIPHFHFMNTKDGKQGCIKILECGYLEQKKYQVRLKSDERKQLQQFLSEFTSEEIYKEGTTNFKIICHEWNKNNPGNLVDINTPLPDYRNLE